MKIVGIDASTKVTGLALIEDGFLKAKIAVDHSKEKDIETRIDNMIRDVDSALKLWDPHVVFIESPWMGNNMQTGMKLAFIIGGIRHICLETGAGFNLILPSAWRKEVGISMGKKKRSELKQEAIDYVIKKYHLTASEDEAEAICIADAAYSITDGGAIFE